MMKTFLIYFLMALLAIVIQATLFTGVKSDLVFVLICFYALKFGRLKGMTYGALTGLIIDSVNGFVLGPHMLSKGLAGFIAVSIREKFFGWNLFLNTILIFFLSILDNITVYLLLQTFTTVPLAEMTWTPLILQVFYTVVAGMILYPVMGKTFSWDIVDMKRM